VPALRERPEDISALALHFLEAYSREQGSSRFTLTRPAMAGLRDYAFPGNVRELENILERAATLCESSEIELNDLQLPATTEGRPPDELQDWLDQLERQRILDALTQTRGNKTRAARLLGITFRALRYRLSRLGMEEK